jgi:hypothetical protein
MFDVVFIMTVAAFFASEVDPTEIFKFGVTPVMLVVLVIFGYLAPKSTINAKDEQIAQLTMQLEASQAQVNALVNNYQERVIPVLSDMQRDLVPTLAKAAEQLADAGRDLTALRETVVRELTATREEVRRRPGDGR